MQPSCSETKKKRCLFTSAIGSCNKGGLRPGLDFIGAVTLLDLKMTDSSLPDISKGFLELFVLSDFLINPYFKPFLDDIDILFTAQFLIFISWL